MSDQSGIDKISREQEFANLLTKLMDDTPNPAELSLEETCKNYPEFEDELRELWGTLVFANAAAEDHSQSQDRPEERLKTSLQLPYDLGNYILEEEIGRGGMGIVFRARRLNDDRMVAIKMILAGDFASEAERKRFHAEAEAAAILDHPNIVPIFEIGEHQGMPYYCMKFIEGQTLSQRLASGPLPTRRAAVMLQKICNAIQYAHRQGVLHRDIKPSNILIDEDGDPYVVDFGLAKQQSNVNTLTKTGAVLGTPSYMSPEQAAGARSQVDNATDIYALGAVLYHMVTGTPPFLGETPVDTVLMVMEQDPINPRVLNPRIHRDLEGIVLRCLQKPKDLRYATATGLSDDLDAYLNGLPVSAREGRLAQVIGHLLRETHHAGVLENWGVLWMWHSLVLLVTSIATHSVYAAGETKGLFYVFTWSSGFAIWAFVFWRLRRRMGPVTFVERQIAHVWGAAICLVLFIYPIELCLELAPLDLAPFLAVVTGLTFVIKAGILSGTFYFHAISLFATAVLMMVKPDCAMLFYGATSSACFFFPGLKYYRRSRSKFLSHSNP